MDEKIKWIDLKPSKNVKDYLDVIKQIKLKHPIEAVLGVPKEYFGV